MNKFDVKKNLHKSIIAVIRCKDQQLAEEMVKTIIQNGIKAIEVTYTVVGAGELISRLKKAHPDCLIGAGTVLNLAQAEEAYNNNADFIVCPCIVEEVAEFCKEKGIMLSLGASTATELLKAYKMGADIIKLFPGDTFKPSIIKAFKGPFPFADLMPTGGVSDKNIKEWFDNGAFAVGAGGYLTKGIDFNNMSVLKDRINKLIEAGK